MEPEVEAVSLLREALELGLGALVLTKEAAEELLAVDDDADEEPRADADLRAKGRRLADELTRAIRGEVDAALARAGLVRREEYEALAARVAALELAQRGAEPAADL